MIRKSIPPGIDPPSSQLPRRLDKPVYSATSYMYADILKKQFSLAPNATSNTTDNTRPPRKRQVAVIDYDSDPSEYPPLSTTKAPNSNTINSNNAKPAPTVDYAAELQVIKTELATLRTLINSAVEQMKTAVESIKTTTPAPANAMDLDDHSTDCSKEPTPEISDLINELKNDIATIATEM